jgi:UPF0755 protein
MSHIKKILIGTLILGIIIGFFIMYNITQTIFKPITAFNNEEAYIYIPSDADFLFVQKELEPLLTDVETFKTLAKKTGYTKRVKGGKYVIQNGMNSNDIIKVLQGSSELVKIELAVTREISLIKDIATTISTQIEATQTEVYNVIVDTIYPIEKGYKIEDLQHIYDANVYTIPWNTSAEEFRAIVYKAYEKRKKRQ